MQSERIRDPDPAQALVIRIPDLAHSFPRAARRHRTGLRNSKNASRTYAGRRMGTTFAPRRSPSR